MNMTLLISMLLFSIPIISKCTW